MIVNMKLAMFLKEFAWRFHDHQEQPGVYVPPDQENEEEGPELIHEAKFVDPGFGDEAGLSTPHHPITAWMICTHFLISWSKPADYVATIVVFPEVSAIHVRIYALDGDGLKEGAYEVDQTLPPMLILLFLDPPPQYNGGDDTKD